MSKGLSAYNINRYGVLVYAGLPVLSDRLTFEHHNGTPFVFRGGTTLPLDYQYEVWAIGQYGIIHGHPFRKFTTTI